MKLTPLSKPRIVVTPGGRYPYTFEKDWSLRADRDLGNHDFQDEFGNVWLEFRGTIVTIKARYAWDGASCAPDFEAVLAASGVHDALCQFRDVPCFPLSKGDIDGAFRSLIPRKFLPRWIYWGAVRLFGGVYHAINPTSGSGSCGLPHGP